MTPVLSKAQGRRLQQQGRVLRVCDDCGSTFHLPREFTGTEGEWVCSPCLDRRSEEFSKWLASLEAR